MRGTERANGSPVVVGWDTCTLRGTLAIGTAERLWAESYFRTEKGHTGWLMPTVLSATRSVGVEPEDIEIVAVGTGPGTFTGTKVGVTTAKAVAYALGVPMLGISTLDLIASSGEGDADLIVSVLDAKRGRLYAAMYRPGDRRPGRVSDYLCLPPDRIADIALSTGFENLLIMGDEPEVLSRALGSDIEHRVRLREALPDARHLVFAAGTDAGREYAADPVDVVPIYLKRPT